MDNTKQIKTADEIILQFTNEHSYESWGELMYDTHEPVQVDYTKQVMELYHAQFQHPVPANGDYQKRVTNWIMDCFSMEICRNTMERNHRFLEEALELVQSLNCTALEAHKLVDYVFNRPVGESVQEVGGVMVTLAALCYAADMDMQSAGETELQRISTPEIIEKIRLKQASKPKGKNKKRRR